MERRLIREYETHLDEIHRCVSLETLEAAVELANLPAMVRGFGPIKEASVQQYDARVGEVRERLKGTLVSAPKAAEHASAA